MKKLEVEVEERIGDGFGLVAVNQALNGIGDAGGKKHLTSSGSSSDSTSGSMPGRTT